MLQMRDWDLAHAVMVVHVMGLELAREDLHLAWIISNFFFFLMIMIPNAKGYFFLG